jgi:superfamily II DNA/RNA helicase
VSSKTEGFPFVCVAGFTGIFLEVSLTMNGLVFRSKKQREEARKKREDDAQQESKKRKDRVRQLVEMKKSIAQEEDSKRRGSKDVCHNDGGEAISQRYYVSKKDPSRKRVRVQYKLDWDDEDDTSEGCDLFFKESSTVKPLARSTLDETECSLSSKGLDSFVPWKEKQLSEMLPRDWRALKEEFEIFTRGKDVPFPLRDWSDAPLPKSLQQSISKAGYKSPTSVQRQCVPLGINGRDMIGIAATGSGKTAAFTIPLLYSILSQPQKLMDACNEDGPLAVILGPTRELVQQIHGEVEKLSSFMELKTMHVIGGVSVDKQAREIRGGVHVIIATPGRLIDLIESQYLVLQQCYYVVLDEADTMIDMGFEETVIEILNAMVSPGKKTTHMFSATMAPAIERLAKTYLDHPVMVRIGDAAMNKDIKQDIVIVQNEQGKARILQSLLRRIQEPTIVFVNTKKASEVVHEQVQAYGYKATLLHGGRSQEQRERAMAEYRSSRSSVLVATDVAGRGIDIPNVYHVINYDMPTEIARYTHRIGRTGRAGADGLATTILCKGHDEKHVPELKKQFRKSGNRWKFEWDETLGLFVS